MPKYEVALGPNEAYLTDDLHIQVVEADLANGKFYEPQISVNGKWRSVSKDYQSFHKTKADAWRAIYKNITRTDGSQDEVTDLKLKGSDTKTKGNSKWLCPCGAQKLTEVSE